MSLPVYKFVDLFSGIGGFRLGFQNERTECVFSSEIDRYASKTYEANFGEVPSGDINRINIKQIVDFDILLAGFPCQPFSSIGLREGFKNKEKGNLFYNILDILDNKNPATLVLENVKGLTNHKTGKNKTIDIIFSELENLGYEIYSDIINSENFGVPQARERLFIIGFKKQLFKEKLTFKIPKKNNSQKADIGSFIESNLSNYSISKHLQENYLFKKNDNKPEILSTKSIGSAKTLVSSYHKIQRLTGSFVKDGPTGLRLLSENECKSLMGFPDSFRFPVSRTQMYRQLGNAVVIPVVQSISETLIEALDKYLLKV